MKIIYLLFLIISVINSFENYFYDIIYNKEYEVDLSKFSPYPYIPATSNIFFRAKAEEDEKMQIEIKVQKDSIINFKLDVCGFYGRPSDIQILYGHDLCLNALQGKKEDSDNNYDIYLFDFEAIKFSDYLAIHIQSAYAFYYLSVKLSKK